MRCAQPKLRACIALLVDLRKTRVKLDRGYELKEESGDVGRAVLCDPAEIVESRTPQVSKQQGATLRVADFAGAKREERIERGSYGRHDASGRVETCFPFDLLGDIPCNAIAARGCKQTRS